MDYEYAIGFYVLVCFCVEIRTYRQQNASVAEKKNSFRNYLHIISRYAPPRPRFRSLFSEESQSYPSTYIQEHDTPKINQPTGLSWQQVRALPPVQFSLNVLEQKPGRSPPIGWVPVSLGTCIISPELDFLRLVYAYGQYPGVHDDRCLSFTVHHCMNESRVHSVNVALLVSRDLAL